MPAALNWSACSALFSTQLLFLQKKKAGKLKIIRSGLLKNHINLENKIFTACISRFFKDNFDHLLNFLHYVFQTHCKIHKVSPPKKDILIRINKVPSEKNWLFWKNRADLNKFLNLDIILSGLTFYWFQICKKRKNLQRKGSPDGSSKFIKLKNIRIRAFFFERVMKLAIS